MSESTLTNCYIELMSDVGFFLFGKRAYENLTSSQLSICDDCVQAGYRQFLYPPTEEGVPPGYEWTFLQQTSSLDTEEDDADQDLPQDFGRLVGSGFTFEANAQVAPVVADVGEGKIRHLRMQYSETGRPRVAGLRRKSSDNSGNQLWEVMWYPTPDDAYTLEFKYYVYVEALSTETLYPLGGVAHSDTLRASCIAAADARVNNEFRGPAYQQFIACLISSIKRDRAEQTKFYGDVTKDESQAGWRSYTMEISGESMYP